MPASFAELQPFENRLLPACLQSAGVDWLLELAPAASPAPAISLPCHRLLLGDGRWCWPVTAPVDRLPFADASLPACLLRYLLQPGVPEAVFTEVLRCLCPGGLLVVVNPNPWHRRSWHGLGSTTWRLPSRPALQWTMLRRGLIDIQSASWRDWGPGLSPVLVLAARKPAGGQIVRPTKFRRPVIGRQSAATGCLRKSA